MALDHLPLAARASQGRARLIDAACMLFMDLASAVLRTCRRLDVATTSRDEAFVTSNLHRVSRLEPPTSRLCLREQHPRLLRTRVASSENFLRNSRIADCA